MARHHAAFINTLAESGSREELLRYLQWTWDDYVDFMRRDTYWREKVCRWHERVQFNANTAELRLVADEMRAAMEDGNGPSSD